MCPMVKPKTTKPVIAMMAFLPMVESQKLAFAADLPGRALAAALMDVRFLDEALGENVTFYCRRIAGVSKEEVELSRMNGNVEDA